MDALHMLNRALMVSAATDLLVIRAGAAMRLGEIAAFTETAMQVQGADGEEAGPGRGGQQRFR